jgi:hypothetical protein
VVAKLHALDSQFINIRSPDFFLTVTAQFSVTQVIGKDEDNIWPLAGLCAKFKLWQGKGHSSKACSFQKSSTAEG